MQAIPRIMGLPVILPGGEAALKKIVDDLRTIYFVNILVTDVQCAESLLG